MKNLLVIAMAIFLLIQGCSSSVSLNEQSIKEVPPMGWNSWNSFGFDITEEIVKQIADYMAENMLEYGWEYLVLDAGWYYPVEMTTNDGHRVNPPQSLDEWGRLIPDTVKFPSAAGGQGFKPLADYVHSKGLKFGIHIMRGIPWNAVEYNLPVKGTSYHAQDIALMDEVCEWNHSMKGVDVTHDAGLAYYNSLFDLYAQWGVDFVKVDDISRPYNASNIEAVHNAIQQSGRSMLLSLSPGPAPVDRAEHLKQHADLWRISNDLWDHWEFIPRQINYCRQWYTYISPDGWPDIDMLPLGKLRVTGGDEWIASLLYDDFENIKNEFTRFTRDEQVTLMNLMAIFRSPLMMGGNLLENDEWTLSLLVNQNIIYVNQHSTNNREVEFGDDWSIWTADDSNSYDKFVVLFNLSEEIMELSIEAEKLGLSGSFDVSDVWTGIAVKTSQDIISASIEPHASVMYRLKKN
jgi:alpha-galactosidase